jgi:hypothetical protein
MGGTMRTLAMVVLALAMTGCDSKVIQNLDSIDAAADLHSDGIHVEIFLLADDGDRLYWEGSILTNAGAQVLPVSELDSRVEVWSLKNGQRHRRVFMGRLRALHWNAIIPNSYRSLLGVVPYDAIGGDSEADSTLGEIDITLMTPKQGNLKTTLVNVQIFPSGYVQAGGLYP